MFLLQVLFYLFLTIILFVYVLPEHKFAWILSQVELSTMYFGYLSLLSSPEVSIWGMVGLFAGAGGAGMIVGHMVNGGFEAIKRS